MSLKHKVETVLFTSARSMSIEEIAEILTKSIEDVEEALLELIMDYSSRDTALEVDDEDGYIIQIKEEYAPIVEKLVPLELSQATLNTLSAIAVKKTILQSDLVTLIGTSAYDHINELLKMNFISKKAEGRSFILKVTDRFYEYFKLTGDVGTLRQAM